MLEGRRTDAAVCAAAAGVAGECGGVLTFVAVVNEWPRFDCGLLYGWHVTRDYLLDHAAAWLLSARDAVPDSLSVRTAVDEGSAMKIIVRRIDVAAHDLVIVRRRWFMRRRLRRPNVAFVEV